jgi:hypothetical protein
MSEDRRVVAALFMIEPPLTPSHKGRGNNFLLLYHP